MSLSRWMPALFALPAMLVAVVFTSPAVAAVPVTGWQETGVRSFHGFDAFPKSQGIATDGKQVFFSWNVGLTSTDLELNDINTDHVYDAIPVDLSNKGLSHIGDIDFYEGKIYAPIEGKPTFEHSTIVTYDPETLEPAGPRFELARDPYLPDGVPWVAIDPVRQVAYTSKWNNTGLLNVHRLSDFEIVSTLELSRPIPRTQGAKVYKGMLYAARDNGSEKSIETIDLDTGVVTNLFDRNLGNENETEGIAFVTNQSGTTMLTSDIDEADGARVDVHSYRVNGDLTAPEITSIRFEAKKIKRGKKLPVTIESSEAVSTTASWSRCVGPKKKRCGRLKPAGRPALTSLEAGTNHLLLPPRGTNWARGKKFNPGRFRLSVTPTDQADAVGPTRFAGFTVPKRGTGR
ncbi:MAG: hypothetical protein WBP55_02025 [Solirubrobacterales bacterium]